MEVRKWLEKNEAPDYMPNIDLLYSTGAKNIDIIVGPSEEEEDELYDPVDIVLDVTLPDDLEKAIDVMISVAYVMQDTSRIERRTSRTVRITTSSPYDYYNFDYKKVWRKPDAEEEE